MITTSSLEVFRSVNLPPGSSFVEEVASLGGVILDTAGTSAIGVGPDNQARRTRTIGALYRPEDSLNYYHLAMAGDNVKHFGGKINDAVERLELGSGRTFDDEPIEERAGFEPLEDTLSYLVAVEHPEIGSEIPIVFDDIIEVKYPIMFPGKKLFALIATERANRFEPELLKRMSMIATQSAARNSDILSRAEIGGTVDTVPIAETGVTDELVRQDFMNHVRTQLLPLQGVTLGAIELNRTSRSRSS